MISLSLPSTHRISFQDGLDLLKKYYARAGHYADVTLRVVGLNETFEASQRILVENIANMDELIATLDTRNIRGQFMEAIKSHNSKQPTSESYAYLQTTVKIEHASGFCLEWKY